MLKPDQQPQEKIHIEITVSDGLKSLFQSLSATLEKLNNDISIAPAQIADEILTPDELAEIFKIPKSKIYSMTMKTGPNSIPRFKIGRDLRFKKSEVLPWFKSQAETE